MVNLLQAKIDKIEVFFDFRLNKMMKLIFKGVTTDSCRVPGPDPGLSESCHPGGLTKLFLDLKGLTGTRDLSNAAPEGLYLCGILQVVPRTPDVFCFC